MNNINHMSSFETTINFIRDILRKNGITGIESIKHCIVFIISRYLTNERCNLYDIPNIYSFDNIFSQDLLEDNNLLMERIYNKKYNCLVGQIYQKLFFKVDFKIDNPNNIKLIYKKLKDIDIEHLDLNFDIIGTIYELHLKTGTSQARDLGQFYSSRHIINYMINICDPKLKKNGQIETILDPTCGSGGFLSMSIKYLNNKYPNIDWNINKNNIFGFDIDENNKNMTLLNLLLETGQLFDNSIFKQDTLKNDIKNPNNSEILSGADIILANEPFGLKNLVHAECCSKVKNLKIRGTKGEPLFLQLMMESLNINGRCAVIVPEGVLFTESSIHQGTRKHLITNYNLKKIIMMTDSFFMNTEVKCAILYFINSEEKTTEVEYLNIKNNNGLINEESIIKVKVDDIIRNKYYLGINKYLKTEEIKHEGLEYKKLSEICNFNKSKKYDTSFGKNEGSYKFYTGGENTILYTNISNIEEPTIIINRTNGKGKCNIFYAIDGACATQTITFNTNNIITTKYIYYYYLSNISLLEIGYIGSNHKNISLEFIKELEIPIPSLEIQNKIVNTLDIIYNKIELNKQSINSYEKIKSNLVWLNTLNCEKKKLNNIIKYLPKSKRQASFGNENGNYPFYTSSNILSKYCNEADYNEECLIIGTGGLANIKIANNFSCSTDNFIIKSEYNKYIYYYLSTNINILNDLFHGSTIKHLSKSDLDNIELPLPSLEIQNKLIQECEYYDNQINILNQENLKLESNNIIDIILASLNNTDEDSEKIIISSNDNILEDSEEFKKIKKIKKSVSKSK